MPTLLNPYINFKDNARQAMEFYKSVFGGVLEMNTFKDFQQSQNPDDDNKIMHSQLNTPNGMVLMASDAPAGMPLDSGSNITISLSGDDNAELRGYWEKLSNGGSVTLPLEVAPWGDAFGMVTDQFGIQWMVNIAGKKE